MMKNTKRDTILETALRLFSQYGYGNVGIERIISESDVARMTVYKQFGTKDGLIKETLELRHRNFMEDLLQYLEPHERYQDKIQALFQWHQSWFQSPDFHGCMFIKASEEFGAVNPQPCAIAQEHKLAILALIEAILQEPFGDKAHQQALLVFICLEGLIVHANMFPGKDLTQDIYQALQPLLAP
ncbi:TetR/AcrR family transcriptional regulator [Alcaligenes aquatilis]|jgi:AcrR family transcriptional regulator|uniref:TetR/AcrR family transcriptional regulator n=1 Tax=Alcaligenes TaxID=507 RepID=UPI000D52E65E|nr:MULTISPECIES: TetR/AcrR family transcriptional regulator [Alcaligenes]AWG33656.1 TetR family transcriptional regulator [Alcaligenes aquatilis]MCC9165120.1 TetR/AcrR family transcriptional regulator [Alcaligenes sp. MMA]MCH4225885.1 TetR/AcrR family transcriptional regulator [Alcaligenes faecalis]QXR35972.1 TetR/AcrR family transcriptional regulator [Alcaligenes aquatilis]UYY87328.1 TetR/AcrR family transcriptional regulator [Alcaligenes sp. SMD-FA]